MNAKSWSNHSRYVVLTDHSSGQLVGNYSTFVNFLKVKETLSRIGVASKKDKTLYQSCHILHKQGRYYLVHFKELFALDGKHANLTLNDVQRRNRIAQLLADWGLVSIVDADKIQDIAPLNQIKVLAFRDKQEWILETKYNIGSKKKRTE